MAVPGFLQSSKRHLGARNVFFGVFQVLEKRIVVPCYALVDVRLRVRESCDGPGFAPKETVEVGFDLGSTTSLEGVALGTASLEERSTLLGVAFRAHIVYVQRRRWGKSIRLGG